MHYNLLVSTHIVCERLFVMQELAWVTYIFVQNPQFTLFLVTPEYTQMKLKIIMDFGSEVAKNTTPFLKIKIVRDFGSEDAKNTPTLFHHPTPNK